MAPERSHRKFQFKPPTSSSKSDTEPTTGDPAVVEQDHELAQEPKI